MIGLLKKIFLVDLFQGLFVTFRNQNPKYIYTEQYPAERPKVAEPVPRRAAAEQQPGEWRNAVHFLQPVRAGMPGKPDCGDQRAQ